MGRSSIAEGQGCKANACGGAGLCTSGVNTEGLSAVDARRGGVGGRQLISHRKNGWIASVTLKDICHHQCEAMQHQPHLHLSTILPPLRVI
jgi:hypothetical protein